MSGPRVYESAVHEYVRVVPSNEEDAGAGGPDCNGREGAKSALIEMAHRDQMYSAVANGYPDACIECGEAIVGGSGHTELCGECWGDDEPDEVVL